MSRFINTTVACALVSSLAWSPMGLADGEIDQALSGVPDALKGDISANVAFTTDYRYRGISQSGNDFAVQGGFDYAMNSGLYIGTWASNVNNFNPSQVDGSNGTQAEVDFYAGYEYALNDNISLGVQALYYYYPGASKAGPKSTTLAAYTAGRELDFWEYTPSFNWTTDTVSGTLSVSYSSDFYGESGDSYYFNGSTSTTLTDWLTLGAHAGYQEVQREIFWYPDYVDWSISLGTHQLGLDWQVAYVGTDLDRNECGGNICDDTVVGTISRSF